MGRNYAFKVLASKGLEKYSRETAEEEMTLSASRTWMIGHRRSTSREKGTEGRGHKTKEACLELQHKSRSEKPGLGTTKLIQYIFSFSIIQIAVVGNVLCFLHRHGDRLQQRAQLDVFGKTFHLVVL